MKKRILPFLRSLALSGIVFAISYLIMMENRVAGALFLAIYSTVMVVRAFRRPIPLSFLTAMLPGIMAFMTFMVQMGIINSIDPSEPMLPTTGFFFGIIPGLVMGIAHRVYPDQGRIYAKRSLLYLLVWAISYGITQVAIFSGLRQITGGALALTGFTSSSLMVLSLFLYGKYRREKRRISRSAVSATVGCLILTLMIGSLLPVVTRATTDKEPPLNFDYYIESEDKTPKKKSLRNEPIGKLVTTEEVAQYFPWLPTIDIIKRKIKNPPLSEILVKSYYGTGKDKTPEHLRGVIEINFYRKQYADWRISSPCETIKYRNDLKYYEGQNICIGIKHERIDGLIWSGNHCVTIKGVIFNHNPNGLRTYYNGSKNLLLLMLPRLKRFSPDIVDKQADTSVADNAGQSTVSSESNLSTNIQNIPQGTTSQEDYTAASWYEQRERNRKRKYSSVGSEEIDASVTCSLIQLLVAAIMASLMSGAPLSGGTSPAQPSPRSPLIDPETGEPLVEKDGRYFVWNKWVDAQEARDWIREQKTAQAARSNEIDQRFSDERGERNARANEEHRARGDRYDAAADTWYSVDYDAARKAEADLAAAKAGGAAMLEKNRQHAAKRLRSMLSAEGGNTDLVDELVAAGRWDELTGMFRDRVYHGIKESVQQHASERNWATAFQVAAYAAMVTEAAAKAGIAVLAGPAGLASAGSLGVAAGSAAVATGAISAAGESTNAYMAAIDQYGPISYANRQKILGTFMKGGAIGFLSGAKDGVIGVYCSLPGTGRSVQVLVPAIGDTTETFLRTGDAGKAITSGALSAVGDVVGNKLDGISNRLAKEISGTVLSAGLGGTGSYLNGGSFGEGVEAGIANRIGSRVGGSMMTNRIGEIKVNQALSEVEAQRQQIIPLEEQPDIIQDLYASRRVETVTDPGTGESRTTTYVDEKMAFDQLGDPGSSRTAKQADPEVQQAIINTRQDKIYGPANDVALARLRQKPEIQNMMQDGDRLVLGSYSTPGGQRVTVGADQDIILTIYRPIPGTDKFEAIQVPDRRLYQDEVYEEFHKHTRQFANRDPDGNITPETEPEYFRHKTELEAFRQQPPDDKTIARVTDQARQKVDKAIKELNADNKLAGNPEIDAATRQTMLETETARRLDLLSHQGLTEQQIDDQAWAASRNQVVTDVAHIEACRDNSNQAVSVEIASDGTWHPVRTEIGVEIDGTVRPIVDTEGNVRTAPAIVEAQRGQRKGLLDDEAYTGMWQEKPREFLETNLPEAVAQGQKGIKQYMKLRAGQQSAGAFVPPIKPHVAEAMDLLTRTPSDSTATDQSIQALEQRLRSITKPDGSQAYPGGIVEVLNELPEQNRLLRAATHQGDFLVSENEGPLASDALRTGVRTGIAASQNNVPPEPVEPLENSAKPVSPEDLDEQLRRLDEQRTELAKKLAARRKNHEGESQ